MAHTAAQPIVAERLGGDLQLGDFAAGWSLHRGDCAEGEACSGFFCKKEPNTGMFNSSLAQYAEECTMPSGHINSRLTKGTRGSPCSLAIQTALAIRKG